MYEYTVNKLSEMLDVDRGVLMRALKSVAREGGSDRKPLFRLSTAVAALERHRGMPDRRLRNVSDSMPSHELAIMFVRLDDAYQKVITAQTLEERRALARAFFPVLADVGKAMTISARKVAEDERLTHLRVQEHERVHLATLRNSCEWSLEEIFAEFDRATGDNPDYDSWSDND
jgi:DNA-binding MarR family transcriptional regulator